MGNLLEFVIEDPMAWDTIPADVREAIRKEGYQESSDPNNLNVINVYHHGKLNENGSWTVYQEAYGVEIDGSRKTYADEDDLPYWFAPWLLHEGEDYGRSYAEDYEGDLQSIDGYEQIMQEGGAAAARFITLIRPGGVTNKRAYEKARNGAVLTGDANDITVPVTNKQADFNTAEVRVGKLEERLARAFLLNSAVRRDAERVTREEIRFVAQELEDQLGGVYSNQTILLQGPYLRKKIGILTKLRRITRVPKKAVSLTVITGSTALGRQAEVEPLITFLRLVMEIAGPQAVPQFVNLSQAFKRLAIGLTLDQDGLVLTEEQIGDTLQQESLMAMIQQLGPEAIKQFGQNVTQTQTAEIKAAAQGAPAQPTRPQP